LFISDENGKIKVFKKKSEIKKYSGWLIKESDDSLL